MKNPALTSRGARHHVALTPLPPSAQPATQKHACDALPPRGLVEKVVSRPVSDLEPFPGNPRRHPEAQLARLMKSIAKIWTNPILIDESATILVVKF